MKVLADLHHFDLYYSLQLLFEERLGWELYRPIGKDWITEGYWNIYPEETVITSYLSVENGESEDKISKLSPLGDAPWSRYLVEMMKVGEIRPVGPGLYSIQDKSKPQARRQRGITFSQFKKMPFDTFLSSVPHHFEFYEELRNIYHPKAKHVFQMGNANFTPPERVQNVMLNSVNLSLQKRVHHVLYHQEFDLNPNEAFGYSAPRNSRVVCSFASFPESDKLKRLVQEKLGSTWRFDLFGDFTGNRTNIICNTAELAETIRDSAFVWHFKPGAEGYGHILHNSFACGRPVLINMDEYKDKSGGALLTDRETCIDISSRSPEEIAAELKFFSQPKEHRALCERVQARFRDVVDFDKEFIDIKSFLQNLR